jgi:hypothetical protein
MKKVFLFFLITIFIQINLAQTPQQRQTRTASNASDLTPYGIKIEPDTRLIVVMATLEAAGIETPLTSAGEAFRKKLREDSQNLPSDLREKIKVFVDRHKKKHQQATAAQITAPFISLAYALGPVPDLTEPARSTELPASIIEVLDFSTLAREFYRRSGINLKLPDYIKTYQAEAVKMKPSAAAMVGELLGYLHTRPELTYVEKIKTEEKDEKNKKKTVQKISTRVHERQFYVVPELLAPAGTINFQNVGDNYYAVVPPNTNLSQSEVRRVYLQFVVDPLVSKNAKDILPFRDGIKQLLEERRKAGVEVSPDVFLAVSRSLVSAIDAKESEYQKVQKATAEARQKIDAAQGVEAKRAVSAELAALKQSFADETAAQLSSAYERGAVLSFYFADQLKGLENSGFDISASLRDIILSLDPAKESNRLAQFAAARNRVILARQASRNKNLELPTKLLEIDALINNKNYSEADAQLKKLLDENPNESRIFYTLGRLSSISAETAFDEALRDKRLDDAKANYSNAIRTANDKTDKALIQLSYVALGRIYEFYEQKEMALKIYEAAVKIGEVENGAYKEAMAAKDKLTKKP